MSKKGGILGRSYYVLRTFFHYKYCMYYNYKIRSPDGVRRRMFPVFAYMIADNPELKLATCVKGMYCNVVQRCINVVSLDSQKSNCPCHVCLVPKADSDNPSASYPLRLQEESVRIVSNYKNAVYGTKGALKAAMNAISLNGTQSAFHQANMGVKEGIHGGTPVDRTHHVFLGLVKTCTGRLFDVMAEHADEQGGDEGRKNMYDEIDRRFAKIPRFKHNEKRYRNFPSGISDLTLLEAKDYASIIQYWPYVFGHASRYTSQRCINVAFYNVVSTLYNCWLHFIYYI
jgi:hypothetical protein